MFIQYGIKRSPTQYVLVWFWGVLSPFGHNFCAYFCLLLNWGLSFLVFLFVSSIIFLSFGLCCSCVPLVFFVLVVFGWLVLALPMLVSFHHFWLVVLLCILFVVVFYLLVVLLDFLFFPRLCCLLLACLCSCISCLLFLAGSFFRPSIIGGDVFV